ncbi:hypothetical protein DFH09DRAFT_1371907 [Mycena vulgaris]|nr:hypothetical protein DFH09DRAFT_1371907 [Mycena vulgaris]
MSASAKYLPKLALENDKALPDAPILLTPLRKHAPSPFFPGRRLAFTTQPPAPPTHGRLHWALPLPALLVALLISALATILLLYLVVLYPVRGADASAILVAEPTHALLGLTISTLATHTASLGAPLLISITGYCVAGTWLKEQTFPRQTRAACPTPIQYAHMAQLLSTARPASVARAAHYLRTRCTRVPRAFRVALGLTGLVLALSYSLILADVWLHAASSIVDGLGRYPLAPTAVYLMLLYAYALTAGGIYLWAARLRVRLVRGRSAAQFAQRRLVDPSVLVGALYPTALPDSDGEDPPEEDESTPRLELGTDDGGAFGVYQRAGPWILVG